MGVLLPAFLLLGCPGHPSFGLFAFSDEISSQDLAPIPVESPDHEPFLLQDEEEAIVSQAELTVEPIIDSDTVLVAGDSVPPEAELVSQNVTKTSSVEIPATSSASIPDSESETEDMYQTPLDLNYFAIFYGPAFKNARSLQPTPYGEADPDRPLILKNYVTVGYYITDPLEVSGTFYWTYRPVRGQEVLLQDPFLKVSHSQIIHSDHWNLYGDFRIHFPASKLSHDNDLQGGFQVFQALTYQVGTTGLSLGTYGSARYNYFGKKGYGYDSQFYLGPNVNYQISSKVAFTLLYEMMASHSFGDPPFAVYSDGTDLEPGVDIELASNLSINPYVNILTGGKVGWDTTTLGMTLSYQML